MTSIAMKWNDLCMMPCALLSECSKARRSLLAAVALGIVLLDSVLLERAKPLIPGIAGLGFLAALIPVLTLATASPEIRSTFDGAFVINNRALALKVLFLVTGLGLATALVLGHSRGDERGVMVSSRGGQEMGPGMGQRNGQGNNGKGNGNGNKNGQGNRGGTDDDDVEELEQTVTGWM